MDTLRILRQAGSLELWYKITWDRLAQAFAKAYVRMAMEMKLLNDRMENLLPETTMLSDSFAIWGYGLGITFITQVVQMRLCHFDMTSS